MPQAATQNKYYYWLRPRGGPSEGSVCIGASGPSGTSRRGSGHRPVRGGGPGKGVGVKARVGSVSGASGHTLRRVSGRRGARQGACQGRVCPCVGRVSRRASGGGISGVSGRASGTRAQVVLRYCDFFRKNLFSWKKALSLQCKFGQVRSEDRTSLLN